MLDACILITDIGSVLTFLQPSTYTHTISVTYYSHNAMPSPHHQFIFRQKNLHNKNKVSLTIYLIKLINIKSILKVRTFNMN